MPEPQLDVAAMIESASAHQRWTDGMLARDGFLIEPMGDDGDMWLAHGHVDKARFLAQYKEWAAYLGTTADEEEWGWPTLAEVRHVHAIEEERNGEPYYTWGGVSADTEGAFDVTVYEQ